MSENNEKKETKELYGGSSEAHWGQPESQKASIWIPIIIGGLTLMIAFALMQAGATLFITDKFSVIGERVAVVESKQKGFDDKLESLKVSGSELALKDHDRIVVLEQVIPRIDNSLMEIKNSTEQNGRKLDKHLEESKRVN
jgi:hypothetical protein